MYVRISYHDRNGYPSTRICLIFSRQKCMKINQKDWMVVNGPKKVTVNKNMDNLIHSLEKVWVLQRNPSHEHMLNEKIKLRG